MVKIIFDDNFKEIFSKIRDNLFKTKIIKQLNKIKDNPQVGKPMMHDRKGTRELYIKPFRVSYKFHVDKGMVEILDLYHKKK